MMETTKTGQEIEYLVRSNPNGFGYEVLKKVLDYDQNKTFRTVVFHSSDKAQVSEVKDLLDKGESIENIKPITDWKPRILVFGEKHGDRFFLVHTIEEFNTVCKKIFKERDNYGWYKWLDSQNEPTIPDFSEDSINTLPESMRFDAKSKWVSYKKQLSSYKEIKSLKSAYALAKEGDASLCRQFLSQCSDGEYDGFRFEDAENF